MTNAPQGPGWWRASDGRWYPPQAPAAPPWQGPPPQPQQGKSSSGVPKGVIILLVVLLVVIGLGYAACSVLGNVVSDRLSGLAGSTCDIVSDADVNAVMGGRYEMVETGTLTDIVADKRLLSEAPRCFGADTAPVAEDKIERVVTVARLETGDAAQRFETERTLARGGTSEERENGITVSTDPFFLKDVSVGDEAFCTKVPALASGVLARRGDVLVYVSITIDDKFAVETDEDGGLQLTGDEERCELSQKLAEKVL